MVNKNRTISLTEEDNKLLKDNQIKPTYLFNEAMILYKKHQQMPTLVMSGLEAEIEFYKEELKKTRGY